MSFRELEISVVGGGWSFGEVDHHKVPGYCIAVNEAGVLLTRQVDEILSMDRLWTENRWRTLCAMQRMYWTRATALQNLEWRHHKWIRIFDNDNHETSMSTRDGVLNGTNSGMCALNRAYQLRPMRLWIFGFDMCKEPKTNKPYWYTPYPWAPIGGTTTGKYLAWSRQFTNIANAFENIGCTVVNVSRGSHITAFKRMTPKQLGMCA